MIEPIFRETLDEYKNRTKLQVIPGEISIHGAPLNDGTPSCRIFTFRSDSTKEQLEAYFNDLYSTPGCLHRWKTVKLEESTNPASPGYKLLPVQLHEP